LRTSGEMETGAFMESSVGLTDMNVSKYY
jgi:hypothetical protein